MANKVLTASGQLRAVPGTVYGVIVSCDGVTSGDKVEFKDALTDTGTSQLSIVFGGTDDIASFCPSIPVRFSTGIYMTMTKTGGTMTVTVLYD